METQATQGEYKEVVRRCREKIRKAEAQHELNLATVVKENKKLSILKSRISLYHNNITNYNIILSRACATQFKSNTQP